MNDAWGVDDSKCAIVSTRRGTDARARADADVGLRSQGLAPAGGRAALSNIGNMLAGAQGARQTRSKTRCV